MKIAIFDMDGTLIDSMEKWMGIVEEFINDMGHKITPEYLEMLHGKTFDKVLDITRIYYCDHLSLDQVYQEIHTRIDHYYQTLFKLKPNVMTTLETLQKMGVTMALATATQDDVTIPALKKQGIYDFFKTIKTNFNTGSHKGEEKFWEITVKELNTTMDNVVVFEDALYSLKQAKNMGAKVVAIEDVTAIRDREELIRLSDQYITDYSQLDYSIFND